MKILATLKTFRFSRKTPRPVFLASKSVTDTIATAMENADKMKTVLIIYESKDGEDVPGGILVQDDVSFSSLNWLVDQAKRWIIE
jgi:hypothetical protein